MACRNELRAQGKPYPRSGCAECGNGGIMGCPHERGDSTVSDLDDSKFQFNHAVFLEHGESSDGKYLVKKDTFGHISEGSIISGCILNAYMAVVTSSARVFIGKSSDLTSSAKRK